MCTSWSIKDQTVYCCVGPRASLWIFLHLTACFVAPLHLSSWFTSKIHSLSDSHCVHCCFLRHNVLYCEMIECWKMLHKVWAFMNIPQTVGIFSPKPASEEYTCLFDENAANDFAIFARGNLMRLRDRTCFSASTCTPLQVQPPWKKISCNVSSHNCQIWCICTTVVTGEFFAR